MLLISSAVILPAFVLRCDRAALNFQRGLYQALGAEVAGLLADQVAPFVDAGE
jgi:hypothetical protein